MGQTGQELARPIGSYEAGGPGDPITIVDRPEFGPLPEEPPPPPVDVLALAEKRPGWEDASPDLRLGMLQTVVFNLMAGRRGDMHVAMLTDPPVDRLTDGADELLPLPDGYTRVGLCWHRPDPMQRFMGELQVSIVGGDVHQLGRVLVLSTIDTVVGPIFMGTFLPRVRVNRVGDSRDLEVFAYHDGGARYTRKAMWAGPGWVALLAAVGVEAGRG